MRKARPADLVFGAVQLGLAYGAANTTGKPSRAEALRLVRRAHECGIATFDTARAYGDSEARLGAALRSAKGVRILTKLSPLEGLGLSPAPAAIFAAVDQSIAGSLSALGRDRLDCLLLHRAAHRTAFDGAVWRHLLARREEGVIAALGVSVQSPAELLAALACPDVAHVQLAFNLLDWRWRRAGAIAAIEARGDVSIHVRSVFLQGLLAAGEARFWPALPGTDAQAILSSLRDCVAVLERESLADLCLAYVRGQGWIDGAVIGMETQSQLETNLRLASLPPLTARQCARLESMIPPVPERLLDPAQWKQAA